MAVTQTRTILITGGAGFIGGCFVRQMLEEVQVRVVNLDKLTYAGNLDSLAAVTDNSSHVFVRGDIGDRALVGGQSLQPSGAADSQHARLHLVLFFSESLRTNY